MIFDKITCKAVYNHTPVGKCKIYDFDGCNTNFLPDCEVIEEKWMPVCKEIRCTYDGITDEKLSEEVVQYLLKTVKMITQSPGCQEQQRMPAGAEFGIFLGTIFLLAALGIFLRHCFPVQFDYVIQKLVSVFCYFQRIFSNPQRNWPSESAPPSYNASCGHVQMQFLTQPEQTINGPSQNGTTCQASPQRNDFVINIPPSNYNGVLKP